MSHRTRHVAAAHYFVSLLTLLCGVMLAGHTFGQDDGSALSVGDFKRRLVQQRADIRSMQFTVLSKLSYDQEIERAGLLRGVVLLSQVRVSWSGKKHRSERSTKSINSNGDSVSENSLSIFDGTENVARESDSQKFIRQEELSNLSVIDDYRNAMLWPVSPSEIDWCEKNPSVTYFLPYFLVEGDWDALPKLQMRDSISCVVFRKKDGSRELWLDPARNYCLVYYRQERPTGGTLRWSNAFSKHVEFSPGIYLPTKITVTHEKADPADTSKLLGKIVNEIAVTNLSVNDVEDSVFALEPESGDWVIDNQSGRSFRYYPDGDTTLEDGVAESMQNYGKPARATSLRSIFLAINLFLLLLGLAAYFAGKRLRKGLK